MRLTLILSAGLLFFGCTHRAPAPRYTEAAFARTLERFVGKSVWDVIDAHGYPHRQFANPDGITVYEYVSVETLTRPMYAYTYPSSYPLPAHTEIIGGESATFACRVWFELDKAGKTVTKTRFKGEACRARESAPSS